MAVLNVTGLDASAAGYVTIWPCNEPRPTASSLNLVPSRTTPNLVVTRLDEQGRACIFTQAGANLIADLAGVA